MAKHLLFIPILCKQLNMNTRHIVLTKRAQKDLQKLPEYIVNKFKLWVEDVNCIQTIQII